MFDSCFMFDCIFDDWYTDFFYVMCDILVSGFFNCKFDELIFDYSFFVAWDKYMSPLLSVSFFDSFKKFIPYAVVLLTLNYLFATF
jgi:hypothetical protein